MKSKPFSYLLPLITSLILLGFITKNEWVAGNIHLICRQYDNHQSIANSNQDTGNFTRKSYLRNYDNEKKATRDSLIEWVQISKRLGLNKEIEIPVLIQKCGKYFFRLNYDSIYGIISKNIVEESNYFSKPAIEWKSDIENYMSIYHSAEPYKYTTIDNLIWNENLSLMLDINHEINVSLDYPLNEIQTKKIDKKLSALAEAKILKIRKSYQRSIICLYILINITRLIL